MPYSVAFSALFLTVNDVAAGSAVFDWVSSGFLHSPGGSFKTALRSVDYDTPRLQPEHRPTANLKNRLYHKYPITTFI